jgi:hypothetical protein
VQHAIQLCRQLLLQRLQLHAFVCCVLVHCQQQ